MAECALETITISGADGYTDANGVYTKTGANLYQNSNGVVLGRGSGGEFWVLVKIYPRYQSEVQDPADCPLGLTFSGVNGTAGSFTLPGGAPSQPTFGLPAETVALVTSRFGSVARFLRLRNQGQV